MAKEIVGSVYWIENARQTGRVADVKEAFSDPAQAKAQILYAERSGDKRQLRLARFAYRQFLGKRYRVGSRVKPRRAAEADEARISKPSGKEFSTGKWPKKPAGQNVETAVSSKPVSNQSRRKAKSSRKSVKGTVGRKAARIPSKPTKGKPPEARSLRRAARETAAKWTTRIASRPPRNKSSVAKSSKRPAGRRVVNKAASKREVTSIPSSQTRVSCTRTK